jgi:hypothetical protein
MIKKKPTKKVIKPKKEPTNPVWKEIDSFLGKVPSNVAFVRDIPPDDDRELWYVFAKGKLLSVNEIKPHIFQTHERVTEQEVCSMCIVVIPRQSCGVVYGPLIAPDSWIVRTKCPIFKARSFRHALQILEGF